MTITNELERQRQQNIKRNKNEIIKLGIHELISENKVVKPKLVKKEPRIIDQEPARKSRRLIGKEPEIKMEKYVDVNNYVFEYNGTIKKDLPNDISLKEIIEDRDDKKSKKFISKIQKEISIKGKVVKSSFTKYNVAKTKNVLSNMRAVFDLPVKITSSPVNCLQIHPNKDRIIAFSGTKKGELIIWNSDLESLANDGNDVLSLDIHRETITCIKVDPKDNTNLFTSSWDGYLKVLDLNKERLKSVFTTNERIDDKVDMLFAFDACDAHDTYFNSMSGVSTMSVRDEYIWAAGNDGLIFNFDHRAKTKNSSINAYKLHYKKIHSIDFKHNDPNMFVTSSLDRSVRIWDVRKIDKPKSDTDVCEFVHEFNHKNSVNSAYYSPESNMLLITCFDDYLYIYSEKEGKWDTKKIKHNNQTGRFITKFKAIWHPNKNLIPMVFCPDMGRSISSYSSTNGQCWANYEDQELITAIPALNCFHPNQDSMLVSCSTTGNVIVLNSKF